MTTPTTTTEPTFVTSDDDTRIAAFVSGHGRPLVLVPGTTSDHTTWRFVAPLLEPHLELYAVDRRGRGASGDSAAYALERECEDVAAVVDAADRTVDAEILARIDNLVTEGERAEALAVFLRDVVHLTDEEFALVRKAPSWPARVATAATITRECRAFGAQAFDPISAQRITCPVLLLIGSESPDEIKADPEVVRAALPDAQTEILHGQAHMAQITAPADLARSVLDFLG